jgi:hypothetical protein
VEQALQPADELGLGDAEFCLARRFVLGERQGQPFELLGKLRGQARLQFLHRPLVNLPQPYPALLVQRGGADLLEKLPDHAADPHDLGGLFDHVSERSFPLLVVPADGHAVRAHDDHSACGHSVPVSRLAATLLRHGS